MATDYSSMIPKEDLTSFQQANPGKQFTAEDYAQYNNPNSSVYKLSGYQLPQVQTTLDASTPNGLIKTPATPNPTNYSNVDYSALFDQAQAPESDTAKQQTALLNQFKNLLGTQDTATQEQAQQFGALGGNEAQAKLKDLTAQYNAADLQNQAQQQAYLGQTRTLGGYTQEAQTGGMEDINRANAVRKLGLAADVALLQGKVETAKTLSEQAIKAKYGDIQAKIDRIKSFIDLNKDILAREDSKSLAKQQFVLANKQKELDAKVAEEKAANDMIINAAPYAPSSLIAKAKDILAKGGSKIAVAQTLGKYGGDYLGDLVKMSTLKKNEAEYAKTIKEIKAMGQPLVNNAPVGTNAYSTNNWINSAVNKESLSADERSSISKAFSVVNQIGALQANLQKDQTSFFGGKVREIKASIGQDADAGVIQAQITALVPQVAKGIYGEVGVLTDQDTSRYKQTLGNLTSPEDQNKVVTALTLTALRNGVKSRLDVAAASKQDVSRFVPLYQDLTNKINEINDETGVNKVAIIDYVAKNRAVNPNLGPMVKELKDKGAKDSEILQILGVEN